PKEPDRWRLVRPEPLPADTATVNSLLFDLRDAKVETFIKTAITDPALFGLAKPSQSLEVSFQDGDSWSLDLGHKTGSGDAYFGRRSGEKIVFKLGKETVEKIFRSLHDLKDKKLLRFDKEQVSRVSVEYPHQTFELIKEGDAWNLRRPEAIEDIEPFLGNDLLWTL
ncbi:MAG: DUF4340 domain-containing protein, partial [Nitrospinaceae bacterium]|nr:DUF4340 domain-containing protein [Nitrospinaceae bacterium]NIR55288.1 DUF4340 domain-containing protein [Nitrospinaceae bacterium]NIS85727.1 DUF4340 domain-containing protein [Nitrospinaceae bacterium]NIT82577.1 DUF4340 domain-containing protein [Nitrospinaceae bacterium]NIU44782.1 DUF4340 domain-containing protein [Nitrospinaceae bacterium]